VLQTVADVTRADPADARPELAAVLDGLPEGQREVLLMRFVDGMSLQEIAAALSIPEGTVKSRLHYGLRTLRLALQEKGVTRP
jgi:RNA polymerase sigma-70 factor (ECF subfamily)